MTTFENPQWIDDLDPSVFCDDTQPDPADDVAVRDWVNRNLRRIGALHRERAIQVELVERERDRIDRFERDTVGGLDRSIAHWTSHVEGWMRRQLELDDRTKSYRLPAGTVASRKLPDLVDVDPAAVPGLLESYPFLARQKVELDKRALNEAVRLGGEFDGVTVETGRLSITVTVDDL